MLTDKFLTYSITSTTYVKRGGGAFLGPFYILGSTLPQIQLSRRMLRLNWTQELCDFGTGGQTL